MPIYVSLVRGTEKGHEAIGDVGKRYETLRKEVEGVGGKILSAYALLGRYDYLIICECPSEKEVVRVLARATKRGTVRFETMTAMPVEEFIKIAEEA